ncbi:hypothetical protein L1049_025512 [Liquidambar formosana]|uniref:Uncharacterized protein n=1 Tax=Liquidambar formosana TaxID=63359 RepID=A0AAP0R6F1_LIQFO
MDLPHTQSPLSLGFHSRHASPSPPPSIADNSVLLQIDSTFLGQSNSVLPFQLQLLEQKRENFRDETGEGEREEEGFSLLGHHMCLKRQREGQSSSSSSSSSLNPPKRAIG